MPTPDPSSWSWTDAVFRVGQAIGGAFLTLFGFAKWREESDRRKQKRLDDSANELETKFMNHIRRLEDQIEKKDERVSVLERELEGLRKLVIKLSVQNAQMRATLGYPMNNDTPFADT